MSRNRAEPRNIGDFFFATRAAMGRDFTLRRFASEALEGRVKETLLGAIEKGTRFPTEALVRRLAALRNEDPKFLLAVLARDRMMHSFRRELVRALRAPRALGDVEDGDLAVVISRAIAALPEDGSWMTQRQWHAAFRPAPRRQAGSIDATDDLVARTESILTERRFVEREGKRVRLRERDYVASDIQERQALALELFELFAKGLLDKVLLAGEDDGTYLRNHFIHVPRQQLPQLQAELHRAVAEVLQRFEANATADSGFLNVLVNSTLWGEKGS